MNKKIMVVDDDPVIRVLIEEYLATFNYRLLVLESGIQCIEKLSVELPDILLLDFQMPIMNGLEVLLKIRKTPEWSTLPVIMLSANSETAELIKKNNVEADLYIVKPFEMGDIRTAIEKLTA